MTNNATQQRSSTIGNDLGKNTFNVVGRSA